MKFFPNIRIGVIVLMTLCVSCQHNDVIEDFEDGSLRRWVIDGNAFNHAPISALNSPEVNGYMGSFYMSSIHYGTSISGQMTSAAFPINNNYVNFLLGGTQASSASVELLINGHVVKSSKPEGYNPNELTWVSWYVASFKGQKANIRMIADFDAQRMGYILLDQIELSSRPKNDNI